MYRKKVSEVVGEFLEQGNYGQAEFAKAYRIAKRGLRNKLNFSVNGSMKSVSLDVQPDLTACIPEDCIKIHTVAVINEQGELATLTVNPRLTLQSGDCQGGYGVDASPLAEEWYMYDNNISLAGYEAGSLGRGSQNNLGEYRIDMDQGLLIFNLSFCWDKVIIEYTGFDSGKHSDTIHPMAAEALLAWIRWQWSLMSKSFSRGERADYRAEFYNELRLAKNQIRMPMIQEINQAIRQSTKSAVKG